MRKDLEDMLNEKPEHSRRSFLKHLVFASAGASAVGLVPPVREAAAGEAIEAKAKSCANVRAPMKELEGKVAFITGGSSGIGLGIARAFADAGMKIAIGYRTKEHLQSAMDAFKGLRANVHAISVDVTDRRGMEDAAAETVRVFGKIHALVNNAGVMHWGPLTETTYEDWDWVVNVNLNGVFNGVKAFLPHIINHGEGGQIVTTASMDGLVAEPWHNPSYTASKFAVVGMMEALRATLASQGIGVSIYCPGAVKSLIGESSRNRPSNPRRADTTERTVGATSTEKVVDPELFMDPREAGRLVVRGMRANRLYILTHPEYEAAVRDRNEALVAAFPRNLHPTEVQVERLRAWQQNSIYSNERDQIFCDGSVGAIRK